MKRYIIDTQHLYDHDHMARMCSMIPCVPSIPRPQTKQTVAKTHDMDKVTTHDMDELIINHDSWIYMDEL